MKNGSGTSSGKELSEIEALKKCNRELKMENEILKKAALITYIRLRGGKFAYLAMWQDKLTGRIIGWKQARSEIFSQR